ncbi:hypothetical protein [Gordonia hankookensis]|uniref:EthD domain-containing protein n=1 Tax=Gordonia hankookensis TaxID=589403 RepID=A0ABR7W9L4_9ACTN|nr:hypothetical protein [Gordonia hankookensis]MBD1319492.1 hypothetical protein [Gordonia hankookensis]NDZ96087.1 hypothetical protein [Streptomyces sp. SID11726]NEB23700.1 hypothetical protein [Streptomyces sp. SID6673]
MPKGILMVEGRPSSPDRAEEFGQWYDEVHMPEVLKLDGFVSGRRLRPIDDDGTLVSLYEIDGSDLKDAARGLFTAFRNGGFTMSDAMQMDPPPVMRFLEVVTES